MSEEIYLYPEIPPDVGFLAVMRCNSAIDFCCVATHTPCMAHDQEQDHSDHFALFGRVRMLRSWCPSCKGWAFVIAQERACCGDVHVTDPTHYRRISNPPSATTDRRRIPTADKKRILEEQDYRCLYCNQRFGCVVIHHRHEKVLRINWDHLVPFCYGQDSSAANIGASCQFCNSWKGSKMFNSLEDARVYLDGKWAEEKPPCDHATVVPELHGIVRA